MLNGFRPAMKVKLMVGFSFSFGVAFLILISLITIYSFNKLDEASKLVSHTHKVLETTEILVLQMTMAESASRGLNITGNQIFLKNFNQSVASVDDNLIILSDLTSDNPLQKINLQKLNKFIGLKVNFIHNIVDLKLAGQNEKVAKLSNSLQGKVLMDSIQISITNIRNLENNLLETRTAQSNKQLFYVEVITTSGAIIALIISIGSLIFIFKELGRREKLELKLIQEEKLLKQFLDTVPVGVLILKSDFSIQFINKKISDYFPTVIKTGSNEKITDQLHTFNIGNYENLNFISIIQNGFAGQKTTVTGLMADSGTDIFLNLIVEPVYSSPEKVEFLICVFADVSLIEKAKTELIKAKELAEESVKMKENFLANMSHEIRTPLNAIIGFSDLLQMSDTKGDDSEFVKAIHSAGVTLLNIINDILDFSKIEAGMINVEKIPFNLSGTLESVKMLLEYKAKEKGLQYIFNIDQNLPKVVLGDSVRLTQILTNLIGNSIKFTENGKVQVDIVCSNLDKQFSNITFLITDTGIGISDDKKHLIFSRFSQGGDDMNRRFGGTGLGLNITQSLTRLLGGKISFESQEGKGSTFRIDLKFEIAEDDKLIDSTVSGFKKFKDRNFSDYKILLIEDNELNQKLGKTILQNLGFTVTIAENGKIGCVLIESNKYDLVLLDLQMPVMNGYETIDYIRNKLKLEIPVIAITAHSLNSEKDKCLSAGMNDYISKPFILDDLYKKINFLLKKTEKSLPSDLETKKTGANDFSYLEEITGGDREMILDFLKLFINNVPDEISKLEEFIGNRNKIETERLSHKIRSSSQIIGLTKIADLLKEIETMEKSEYNWNSISSGIIQIRKLFDESIKKINEKIEIGI